MAPVCPACREPWAELPPGESDSGLASVSPGTAGPDAVRCQLSGKVRVSAPTDAELWFAGALAFDEPECPATNPPTAAAMATAAAIPISAGETRAGRSSVVTGAGAGGGSGAAAGAVPPCCVAAAAPAAWVAAPGAPAARVASPPTAGRVASPARAGRVASTPPARVAAAISSES